MKKYVIAISTLTIILFLAFFMVNKAQDKSLNNISSLSQSSKEESKEEVVSFTMEEIAIHNNKDDCWLLIDGSVYDVTDFVPQHPGEEKILEGCGKDATEMFATKGGSGVPHSSKAINLRNSFKVGVLKTSQ